MPTKYRIYIRPLVGFLVLIFLSITGCNSAATQSTSASGSPNPIPSQGTIAPVTPQSIVVFVTPTPSTEDVLATILNTLASFAWPLVVVTLAWIYRKQMQHLIDEVESVDIGGQIKIKRSEIRTALYEREKLRAAIKIANADNKIQKEEHEKIWTLLQEMGLLNEEAEQMTDYWDKMSESYKKKILEESIEMAIVDEKLISKSEYDSLADLAKDLNLEKYFRKIVSKKITNDKNEVDEWERSWNNLKDKN